MASFDDLKHILALIYIIPSFLLYFIILYIVFFSSFKKNFFNGSFYWIFCFSAINNIIQSVTYYIIYRFVRIPALEMFLETWPTESIWYPIVFIAMYYSASAEHIYSLMLSFNRVTIFIFKHNHTNFWKNDLKYALWFCVLAPIFFVWNFPFIGIQNQPISGFVVYIGPTNTNFVPWFNRSTNLFIEILFTSVSSLIMNGYFMFGVIKWRYSKVTGENNHITHQDVMMFVCSLLIFSTEAFSCVQQCMLAIDRPTFLPFVTSTQFILADVGTLAPAWFLIATNKLLREAILNMFWISNNKVIQISSIHTTSSLTHQP